MRLGAPPRDTHVGAGVRGARAAVGPSARAPGHALAGSGAVDRAHVVATGGPADGRPARGPIAGHLGGGGAVGGCGGRCHLRRRAQGSAEAVSVG
eukprot:5559865-Pyramimonas_sp.AAC.1